MSFWRRAGHGMLASVLLFAALNAASYFVRSDASKLMGDATDGGRIGFPWLTWEHAGAAGGRFHGQGLLFNVIFALLFSGAAGVAFALTSRAAARGPAVEERHAPPPSPGGMRRALRFSLVDLLLLTAGVAAILALGQKADQPVKLKLLMTSYWLGPAAVVAAYLVTARQGGEAQTRATIGAAALMVGASLALGPSAGIGDATQVVLGLFVYWTPQCVLLLGCLWAWRALRPTISNPAESRD